MADAGHVVEFSPDVSWTNLSFGNRRVTGVKFDDINRDGQRGDGEPLLPGWEIRAYLDVDGSGDLSAGDTLEATATTDADGEYFLSLDPGDYLLVEALQSGWEQTAPDNGVNSGFVPDAGDGYAVTVTEQTILEGLDFGNSVTRIAEPEDQVVQFITP